MILPKISIIMTSFNQDEFIEEAILSVINQNYPNMEFIIIDGGSNDNTQKIIKKYKEKIDYFISEKDYGLYHAYNKGFLQATGKYIGCLASDDFYEKKSLLSIGEFLSNNLNVDLVYGIGARITKDKKIINYFGDFEYEKEKYLKYSPTIPHQSAFFRKECLAYIGLYDTSLKFGGDTDLWKRFAKYDLNISHIDKHIGNWRVYDGTLSYRPDLKWERALEAMKVDRRYTRKYFGYTSRQALVSYLALTFRKKKWARYLYFLLRRKGS